MAIRIKSGHIHNIPKTQTFNHDFSNVINFLLELHIKHNQFLSDEESLKLYIEKAQKNLSLVYENIDELLNSKDNLIAKYRTLFILMSLPNVYDIIQKCSDENDLWLLFLLASLYYFLGIKLPKHYMLLHEKTQEELRAFIKALYESVKCDELKQYIEWLVSERTYITKETDRNKLITMFQACENRFFKSVKKSDIL